MNLPTVTLSDETGEHPTIEVRGYAGHAACRAALLHALETRGAEIGAITCERVPPL